MVNVLKDAVCCHQYLFLELKLMAALTESYIYRLLLNLENLPTLEEETTP